MSSKVSRRIAERFLLSMAYRRREFKNKLESHLVGAIVEFYKSRLAERNGLTKWVRHWKAESERLIERELVREILHPIRGFRDRRRALSEAMAEIRASDNSFRKYAETTIKKDYGLARIKKPLRDSDAEEFWAKVDEVAASAIESTE